MQSDNPTKHDREPLPHDVILDPLDTPRWEAAAPDPHILDYFTLVARHRTAVIACTFLTGLLVFVFTLFWRQTYSSIAYVIPPEKQQGGGLLSFLSGSGALDILKSAENPALDLFKNVLDSRSLSEEIARDPLVYHYFSQWDTAHLAVTGMVHESMTAEPLRNSMMTVQVDVPTHWNARQSEKDSAKMLSAYLANLFVAKLDNFNRERLVTVAKNTRTYVEKAYHDRMAQLDSTYVLLQGFQKDNRTVALTDQLSSTVQAAAMLQGLVQQLQMQIGVEERELQPNSTRLTTLRAQLQEAEQQLAKFDDGSVGEYSIALQKAPELTRRLAGFTREIKLLEQITAYLRQQVEQERINEQRNVPTLQVLDPALPPDRKSSPRKLSMLLLGCTVGFAFSLLWVGFKTYTSRVSRNRYEHRRMLNFVSALRHGSKAKFEVAVGPVDSVVQSSNAGTSQLRERASKPTV